MELINTKEAAKHYAYSPKTLRKLAQQGKVQAAKIGSRWKYAPPAVKGESRLPVHVARMPRSELDEFAETLASLSAFDGFLELQSKPYLALLSDNELRTLIGNAIHFSRLPHS